MRNRIYSGVCFDQPDAITAIAHYQQQADSGGDVSWHRARNAGEFGMGIGV
jgi:hypothetical protein